MCVYLASHGLIASHLAIYKQASLKNNECVRSINTRSRWGNWRLEGKPAGFILFSSGGECEIILWASPRGEARADMQGSSSSSAAGVGLLFTHRCSVICTGEHTRSQWSATLAGGVEVEAFFPSPASQDNCPANPWELPRTRKMPPKCGLSSYSSAPVSSALWKPSQCKVSWPVGLWCFAGTPNIAFPFYVICSRSLTLQSNVFFFRWTLDPFCSVLTWFKVRKAEIQVG